MKPFILAITGPTGSGKSTVASRLATDIPQCVNIEVDQVKHFIVNGFIYESPEGLAQWELLGVNIGQLAKNFHEAGYNVVINGYLRSVSGQY
jgi:adenylylsulfate kinase-like enzyme